ncbi:uncharacterized protein NMK_0707 [Novimethylophilus kurashikiensis]|uniref:Uncharacterized protein n=1 Tax=Novimethylophilus kurashikiensis TaxID=1825523 RepID=A0A2R5F8C8_9PROT|nr:uncharacterized protein NMK_0707 [Novimethylophilus kurashikiensis]
MHAMQALSQLSYTPVERAAILEMLSYLVNDFLYETPLSWLTAGLQGPSVIAENRACQPLFRNLVQCAKYHGDNIFFVACFNGFDLR